MLEQPQEGNAPRPPLPLPLRPIGGEAPASDTAHNDETNAPNPADYAVMARAALERVEELSKQIEGLEGLVPMCREAWRDYGQPMRAQRLLEPSDKKFGAWVKESRADTGRASSPVTRTDAMWV